MMMFASRTIISTGCVKPDIIFPENLALVAIDRNLFILLGKLPLRKS
jgi:hypothetical protein